MITEARKGFDAFFSDPLYLLYKNCLYNYLVRRFVIRRHFQGGDFKEVLELGCGISPMLPLLNRAVRTDLAWQALAFLKSSLRKGTNAVSRGVACHAGKLPFRANSLDCVICSEVLEHIEKDGEVLKEMNRVLERGGSLFLTCPIQQRYFGFDDQYVGHFRRYEVKELVEELKKNGFGEFQIEPVLGRMEKWVMEKITRFFSLLKREEGPSRPLGGAAQLLAWIVFPFYVVVNYGLACFVYVQARLSPPEKVMTAFIRCRKLS